MFVEMNSVEKTLYEEYKEELQNLLIGYNCDTKRIKKMIELIFTNVYINSDYAADEELLKYLKLYD